MAGNSCSCRAKTSAVRHSQRLCEPGVTVAKSTAVQFPSAALLPKTPRTHKKTCLKLDQRKLHESARNSRSYQAKPSELRPHHAIECFNMQRTPYMTAGACPCIHRCAHAGNQVGSPCWVPTPHEAVHTTRSSHRPRALPRAHLSARTRDVLCAFMNTRTSGCKAHPTPRCIGTDGACACRGNILKTQQ